MVRKVRKAMAFLLAFALVFSMVRTDQLSVRAETAAETEASQEECKSYLHVGAPQNKNDHLGQACVLGFPFFIFHIMQRFFCIKLYFLPHHGFFPQIPI